MPGMDVLVIQGWGIARWAVDDLPEEASDMGTPPMWMGYVGVDDVDAATAKVEALGGKRLCRAAGHSRASAVSRSSPIRRAPPLRSSSPGARRAENRRRKAPGLFGWHELYANDWQKAFDFYSDMFGWKKAEAVDMGPMGTYQTFVLGGDLLRRHVQQAAGSSDAVLALLRERRRHRRATARVKDAGGEIVNGPMEVPGGMWIVQGKDPQGVMFALVGPRA